METKIVEKAIKATTKIAKNLAIANVNATCAALIHQPKIPKELLRYKK